MGNFLDLLNDSNQNLILQKSKTTALSSEPIFDKIQKSVTFQSTNLEEYKEESVRAPLDNVEFNSPDDFSEATSDENQDKLTDVSQPTEIPNTVLKEDLSYTEKDKVLGLATNWESDTFVTSAGRIVPMFKAVKVKSVQNQRYDIPYHRIPNNQSILQLLKNLIGKDLTSF